MLPHKDLSGQRFGKLLVVKRGPPQEKDNNRARFWATCDCGRRKLVQARKLVQGLTKCCGCSVSRTHGQTAKPNGKTAAYHMWIAARVRAKKLGVPFGLEVADILVPRSCPLLGITLKRGSGRGCGPVNTSPTLDRIIPELGYVRSNVWVISMKANRSKNDLSLSELKQMVAALEKKIQETGRV